MCGRRGEERRGETEMVKSPNCAEIGRGSYPALARHIKEDVDVGGTGDRPKEERE